MKRTAHVLAVLAIAILASSSWAVTAKICVDPATEGDYGPWLDASNKNLYMGLKLRDWLNSDTNDAGGGGSWSVVMTRTTHVNLTASARAGYANNNGCNRYVGVSMTVAETQVPAGEMNYTVKVGADSTTVNFRDRIASRMAWSWTPMTAKKTSYNLPVLILLNMPGEDSWLGLYALDPYVASDTKLNEAAVAHLYAIQEAYSIAPYNPGSVPSIIVDNTSASFSASSNWSTGTTAVDKYGTNYRWRDAALLSDTANWNPSVSTAGMYNIYAWWSVGTNRSKTALYLLPDNAEAYVNQQTNGGRWNLIGTKYLAAGNRLTRLSCWVPTGFVVIADAIKYAK